MVLIDSSIIINFINGNQYRDKITTLISQKKFCTTEIIIMEILQGTKEDGAFFKIKSFMESLPLIQITYDDYIEAANIYRTCRKKGITIRTSADCLIAAVAMNHNLELFSNDRDFDNIRKHFNLKYHQASNSGAANSRQ